MSNPRKDIIEGILYILGFNVGGIALSVFSSAFLYFVGIFDVVVFILMWLQRNKYKDELDKGEESE